jgi:hypothetical protein
VLAQVWRTPQVLGRLMHRSYTFPDRLGRNIVIHEKLEESSYPFAVAKSILQSAISFRRVHNDWLGMRVRKIQVGQLCLAFYVGCSLFVFLWGRRRFFLDFILFYKVRFQ